ncbi:SPOR domain-containing protein [Kozakia baliensis]|uniref:SPOR domain-containing protein n=1 Tax=Kozakia baliensis TaxID=153496 RepID=UPI00345C1199
MSDDTPDWRSERGRGPEGRGPEDRRPEDRGPRAPNARGADPRFTDTRPPTPGAGEPRVGAGRMDDARLNRARERMSSDYDEEPPPQRRRRPSGIAALLGTDKATQYLSYGAVGLGAVLILGVGGWTLLGGHQSGIPVLGPPPGPVRDLPADPGGMQIMSGEGAESDTTGHSEAHLAPGPEQPRPDALAAQYGQPPADAPKPGAAPKADTPAVPSDTANTPDAAAPSAEAPKANTPSAAPADKALPAPAPVKEPPPKPVPTHKAEAPAASPRPAPMPQKPVEVPAASGGHMVQLAALGSEADAHNEWEKLSHQAPDLFSGRSPVFERTDHGGHSFYRLRVGGFESNQAARAFCVRLHARAIACTPAQF